MEGTGERGNVWGIPEDVIADRSTTVLYSVEVPMGPPKGTSFKRTPSPREGLVWVVSKIGPPTPGPRGQLERTQSYSDCEWIPPVVDRDESLSTRFTARRFRSRTELKRL